MYRSRLIEFPDAAGLRPTPDRVRETLFNWLGQSLNGKRCLDLFAGSGALGIEAASRQAAQVVMVESNSLVHRALQASMAKFSGISVTLHCENALEFIKKDIGKFDVIFLDPPFQQHYVPELLPELANKLTAGGLLYVESNAEFKPDAVWEIFRQARAGVVYYQLLQLAQPLAQPRVQSEDALH